MAFAKATLFIESTEKQSFIPIHFMPPPSW